MKDTLFVNLTGAPGTGKSTTMSEVFAKLKRLNIDCEMVPEFAKELVWEKRKETLRDQLYVSGKQHHRIFRLNGYVDVAITDSPLILGTVYNRLYNPATNKEQKHFNNALEDVVFSAHTMYRNIDVFLTRTKPYNPNGRIQSEEESNELANTIKSTMDEHGLDYIELPADNDVADKIVEIILKEIEHGN